MLKITINEELILKHANADDAIYVAGNFNDWNCEKDQLEYDPDSKVYTKTLDINEKDVIIFKFANGNSNEWFSLPNNIITIDESNGDGNNYLDVSNLPTDTAYVKFENLDKEQSKNYIVLQEEQGEIDNNHVPNGLTNTMRSESYSNILISTDDNDKISISSSFKSTKLDFEGETPPSENLKPDASKPNYKENGKYQLLKRIFGYK